MNHKQTRAEKIKALIQSAAKKAGSKDLDLTRKEVENLHQKTYKEFIEAVVSQYDARHFDRKFDKDSSKVTLGPGQSYSDVKVQQKIQQAKRKKEEIIQANNEQARRQRAAGGMRGTQGGKWGTFRNGNFYPDSDN
jgi:hypothetical protein